MFNTALWAVQALLALALFAGGAPKVFGGKAKLIANPRMAWSHDFPDSTIRFIGLAEFAAATGLLVTPVLDVWLWSVPAAAAGVIVLMVGAAWVHLRRKETKEAFPSMVFIVLAALVLIGRLQLPLHP